MEKVNTLQAADQPGQTPGPHRELASMVEWALERWARDACAGIVQHSDPTLPEFKWISDSHVSVAPAVKGARA